MGLNQLHGPVEEEARVVTLVRILSSLLPLKRSLLSKVAVGRPPAVHNRGNVPRGEQYGFGFYSGKPRKKKRSYRRAATCFCNSLKSTSKKKIM